VHAPRNVELFLSYLDDKYKRIKHAFSINILMISDPLQALRIHSFVFIVTWGLLIPAMAHIEGRVLKHAGWKIYFLERIF
jgi:hypothetical protein